MAIQATQCDVKWTDHCSVAAMPDMGSACPHLTDQSGPRGTAQHWPGTAMPGSGMPPRQPAHLHPHDDGHRQQAADVDEEVKPAMQVQNKTASVGHPA